MPQDVTQAALLQSAEASPSKALTLGEGKEEGAEHPNWQTEGLPLWAAVPEQAVLVLAFSQGTP